jgi:hypothetical protein
MKTTRLARPVDDKNYTYITTIVLFNACSEGTKGGTPQRGIRHKGDSREAFRFKFKFVKHKQQFVLAEVNLINCIWKT